VAGILNIAKNYFSVLRQEHFFCGLPPRIINTQQKKGLISGLVLYFSCHPEENGVAAGPHGWVSPGRIGSFGATLQVLHSPLFLSFTCFCTESFSGTSEKVSNRTL
jgi:hypothetical protein